MVEKVTISCGSAYCATDFYLVALWVRKITADTPSYNNALKFPLPYKFGDVLLLF